MKKYMVLITILLMSVEACAQKQISWKSNGKVNIGEHSIKLKMQNAYYGYTFQNSIYVIGFEIDKQGNNTPTLARVSDADRVPKYWTFNNVLQEVFMLDGRVHLLDMDGEVRKLENEVWRKLPLKLKNNAKIIDTENGKLA